MTRTDANPAPANDFLLELDLDGRPTAAPDDVEPLPVGHLDLDRGPRATAEIVTSTPAPLAVVPESSAPVAVENPIGDALTGTAGRATRLGRNPISSDVPAPLRIGALAARARANGDTTTAATLTARAAELTDAQRKRVEAAETAARARAALNEVITFALRGADGTYPHGLIANWKAKGERPWQVIADAAARAGVDAPAKRSLKAVASKAVRKLADANHKITTVTAGSEWVVYEPAGAVVVGDSVGSAKVGAKLVGDEIELTGPGHVVRAAFARAQAEDVIGTAEITAWLGDILATWGAVPTLYGRWVAPGRYSATWVTLANALADTGIRIPRKPAAVSSREDIAEEVTEGLRDEVAAALSLIQAKRDRAVEAGNSDLGIKGAINALTEIADLGSKLAMYECLTGPLPEARAHLAAMHAALSPLVDDASRRFAVLDLYETPMAARTEAA